MLIPKSAITCNYFQECPLTVGQRRSRCSAIPEHLWRNHGSRSRVLDLIHATEVGLQFRKLGFAHEVLCLRGPVTWLRNGRED